MSKKATYSALVQEYLSLNTQKRNLPMERNKISAQLDIIEDMLIAINDILCKNGDHIYEHFVEREDQA